MASWNETLTTCGEKDDSGEKVDMGSWLEENRLSHISDVFTSKNVMIDELLDFKDEELEQYAIELGLDVLSRKRFVKGLIKLKQQKEMKCRSTLNVNNVARTGAMKPLIVSKEEQESISRLYNRYEMASELMNEIRNSVDSNLTKSVDNTRNEIKSYFDDLINDKIVKNKKEELSNEMNSIYQRKRELIQEQIGQLKNHLIKLKNGKNEIESMLIDPKYTGNHQLRKSKILEMYKESKNECKLRPITSHDIKLIMSDQFSTEFAKTFYVSRCDYPIIEDLNVKKVTFSRAKISWNVVNDDSIDKINQECLFKIECCVLKKSMLPAALVPPQAKKKKERKNVKRKRKDTESGTETDSGSESESESEDNDNESESSQSSCDDNDEKKEINKINEDKQLYSLDISDNYWSKHCCCTIVRNPNKIDIVNKTYGYTLENLKSNSYFALRICGKFSNKIDSSIKQSNESDDNDAASDSGSSGSQNEENEENKMAENDLNEWSPIDDRYLIFHTKSLILQWHKGIEKGGTAANSKVTLSDKKQCITFNRAFCSGYHRQFINYVIDSKDWKHEKFVIEYEIVDINSGVFMGYVDLTKFPNAYQKYLKYRKKQKKTTSKKNEKQNKFTEKLINEMYLQGNLHNNQYLGSSQDNGYTLAFGNNQRIGYAYHNGTYRNTSGVQNQTIPLPSNAMSGDIWRVEFDFKKRTVTYFQNDQNVGIIFKGNTQLSDAIICGVSTVSGNHNNSKGLIIKIRFVDAKKTCDKKSKAAPNAMGVVAAAARVSKRAKSKFYAAAMAAAVPAGTVTETEDDVSDLGLFDDVDDVEQDY